MSRVVRNRRATAYGLIVVFAVVAIAVWAVGRLDVANFLLTLTVLFVSFLALQVAWPLPAKLFAERQQELRHIGDLIFWLHPEPDVPEGLLPTEAVLEMYVAVANIGGRKALLLGLSLEDYLDTQGKPVRSQVLPAPVLAHEYRQWESRDLLASSIPRFLSEKKMPPFVLEPDQVLSLRLRARRSVEYKDPQELKKIASSLVKPITQARLLLIYRRGASLVRESVVIPLAVDVQEMFVKHLAIVSKEFSEVPTVEVKAGMDNESGFPIPR